MNERDWRIVPNRHTLSRIVDSGRLREIQDEDGKIKPSEESVRRVQADFPHLDDDEKLQLAIIQTVLDLATKFVADEN